MKIENKNIIAAINEFSCLFKKHMNKKSIENNINETYRPILIALYYNNGLTQSELTRKTRLAKPTITLTLQKMEQEGIVERKRDFQDQRLTRVFLTDKGYQMNKTIINIVQQTEEFLLKDLSEEEKEVATSILDKITSKLKGEEWNENF